VNASDWAQAVAGSVTVTALFYAAWWARNVEHARHAHWKAVWAWRCERSREQLEREHAIRRRVRADLFPRVLLAHADIQIRTAPVPVRLLEAVAS
jgi:hypothetical protein